MFRTICHVCAMLRCLGAAAVFSSRHAGLPGLRGGHAAHMLRPAFRPESPPAVRIASAKAANKLRTPKNARYKVHVAQPEEQRISNPQVAGSSPAVDANNIKCLASKH